MRTDLRSRVLIYALALVLPVLGRGKPPRPTYQKIEIGLPAVTLGRDETRIWKSATSDSYKLRDRVLREVERFVRSHGTTGTVEIYAAKEDGGWTADVLRIEGGHLSR